MNTEFEPAVLLLEDGRLFRGQAFGARGETIGEVCFNTGMSGYQEILTDPSYRQQIVTMTTPHIGNYGVNPDDIESGRIQVAGFVIREETVVPSNQRATMSIGEYLQEYDIVGIQGIDTRALVRHIRERGAMNGIIATTDFDPDSLREKLNRAPGMKGLDLCMEVTSREKHRWDSTEMSSNGKSESRPEWRVAAIDYGIKYNILRLLSQRHCDITVFPADVKPEEILAMDPDGIFLSNGPGDPAAVTYAIETLEHLLGEKPIFGICLGHQLLSHAVGAKTFKLKFGHRGINHPVRNLRTGKVEITSQNHGFAVDEASVPSHVEITHMNLNDNTVEGIYCKDVPAFSVQYHPEASPGPHDSRYLFDDFIKLMRHHSN
ncbi:MAG TPA: glutamine-hydrolyzing carbamoyl-phosphate synthase small subunit [bacterium]|nr:glutamine-hydrolyzing carbamoyl-phosphate synthase small subunit [bacterium]